MPDESAAPEGQEPRRGQASATWGGPAPWREEDLPAGTSERQRLEHAFGLAIRRAGSVMQLLGQAAADRIGINATDLNCLNILSLTGPMTAGELARATGLTTASITGVVDRLEASGFVRRERDTHDRRRVVIHVIFERAVRDVVPVFAPMMMAWQAMAASYSDEQLALIVEFERRIEQLLRAHLVQLRGS